VLPAEAPEEGRRGRRSKADKPAQEPTAPKPPKAEKPPKPPKEPKAPKAAKAPKTVDGAVELAAPKRRPVALLAVLGAVVVLAAIAAFVWPGLLVSSDGSATPTPVVPAHPAAAAVTLAAPDSAAGLTKLTGPAADALTGVTTEPLAGLTQPVAAVYGTGTTPSATVIAWKATGPVSTDAVSTAYAGIDAVTGTAVSGVAPVDAGTLGGQMRCGATTSQGKPASVCFWADSATFGAVTVLSPASPAAAATTALQIRQAVETHA
jgi:hypothetical protein